MNREIPAFAPLKLGTAGMTKKPQKTSDVLFYTCFTSASQPPFGKQFFRQAPLDKEAKLLVQKTIPNRVWD